MYIYIVRHCSANEAYVDPEKRLSPHGIEEAKSLAEFLKPMKIRVSQILHSGKMRARETAEILSSAVKCSGGLSKQPGLNPDDSANQVAKEISKFNENLMIVSHLPLIENLAAYLLKGDSTKCGFNFSPGALMCLKNIDSNNWKLEWMISPALLEKK